MASVKKKRAKSKPSTALAVKEPPTVFVGDVGEAAYVRVPLPPEVVAAAREHVDNAARLFALVKAGGAVSLAELLSHLATSSAAIERDVAKLRKRRTR